MKVEDSTDSRPGRGKVAKRRGGRGGDRRRGVLINLSVSTEFLPEVLYLGTCYERVKGSLTKSSQLLYSHILWLL